MFPAAEARGQKHTFFLTSGWVNTAGYVTSAQIQEFFGAGHEIGAHSTIHQQVLTTSMPDPAARAAQYDTTKSALEAIVGAGKVTSWAWPFGAHNAINDQECYLRYSLTANVSSNGDDMTYPRESIRARSIMRIQWHGVDHARLLGRIRAWANKPVTIVLYSHRVPADLTEAQMLEMMDLVDELGIETLTLQEAFQGDEPIENAGFEDGLNGWLMTRTDTSQTAEVVTDTPHPGLNGTKSLHIATTNDTAFVTVKQRYPVTPGRTYTVSGRARVGRTGTFNGPLVRVKGYLGDGLGSVGASTNIASGAQFGLPGSGALALQTTWTRWTGNFVAGATETWADVELIVQNGQSEAYFDHIDIRPAEWGGVG